jgi:cytochrome c-type biogenesis protein CcmH/NrfG
VNLVRYTHHKTRFIFISLLMAACPVIASAATPDAKERATAALEQDVKADPNNAELWLHLGYAYRKDGQVDQSQNAFEKASSLDPRNPNALYMLGLIYEKKHQKQEALRVWKNYLAVESDPSERAIAEKHIHLLSQ